MTAVQRATTLTTSPDRQKMITMTGQSYSLYVDRFTFFLSAVHVTLMVRLGDRLRDKYILTHWAIFGLERNILVRNIHIIGIIPIRNPYKILRTIFYMLWGTVKILHTNRR